jgi:hypothetical protein
VVTWDTDRTEEGKTQKSFHVLTFFRPFKSTAKKVTDMCEECGETFGENHKWKLQMARLFKKR